MGLTYKWQVSTDNTGTVFSDIPANSVIVSGVNTNTITFRNLTTEDHRKKYRVVVGSTDFSIPPIVSDAATLFTAPTITLSAISNIAITGSQAVFSVSGVSNTGVISYQWQKRISCAAGVAEPCFINLIDQPNSVSGSNTAILTLSNLESSVHNNSQYRVIASAQCCGTTPITQSSNIATLQVATPGQTLFITKDLTDATIATDRSSIFDIEIQTTTTNSAPVPVTFAWQKLVASNWTTLVNTQPIQNTVISPTLILYKQILQVPSSVDGESYRVIVSDGRTSITSSAVKTKNPATCTNCGGSGTGDPHLFMSGTGSTRYGFDDNPIMNGHKEIIMIYIKNKKDNVEHILTTKNSGAFGTRSPYNVGSTTYTQIKDGKVISSTTNTKMNIMDIVRVQATKASFNFSFSILEPHNIHKIQDLDIVIGGAWYWMFKSLIRYLKKDPAFMKLGWPHIGWIHADGISLGLAPYGLIREDFEIDNLRVSGGPAHINGLYIAFSNDNKNNINYNKDNSAYSIIRNNNLWEIKTRSLSPVAITRISETKFSLNISGGNRDNPFQYNEAESLAVGLGVGSSDNTVLSGNPIISSIVYNNNSIGRAQEAISAEITIQGGQILKNGSVSFGYFVNTTNNTNTIILPSIFTTDDIYVGQKLNIPGSLVNAKVTNINGSTITVDKNCTATGRFPLEIVYAISNDTTVNDPSNVAAWYKNEEQIHGMTVSKSLSSPEGLARITEDINQNPLFWRDLSLALSGKPLDGTPVNSIISHPKDAVSINGIASFSVSAEFANSKYQWQRSRDNGASWTNIAGATSSTFLTNALRSDNGTLFRVRIDNLLTSNSARLSVPSTLNIQQAPSDTNSVNLQAVFSVVASGVSPLVYKWQKSDDQGVNYVDVNGGNLPSLVLQNLTLADDGDLYRVSVQDGAGDSYVSVPGRLSINPILSITSQPINQIASENETASFSVSGVCNNGSLQYQWQVSTDQGRNYSDYSSLSSTGNILNLSELKIYDDNKTFRAKLVSDLKNNIIYSSGAVLRVPGSISILSQPINTISNSGNASFSISATSSQPPLTYQWQKAEPNTTTYTDIVGATGSLLNIAGLKLSDDNTYYRVALTDQRGTVYSSGVFVDTTPQISIINNISGYNANDYKLNLSIVATTTEGDINYYWEKAEPSTDTFVLMSGENSNTISGDLIPANSGIKYRAKVSVSGARDVYSNVATIHVPASISLLSALPISKKIVLPSNDIELSINAETTKPPLQYQWQKSSPIKTNFTYEFTRNDIFYDKTMLFLPMSGASGSKVFIDESITKTSLALYRNNSVYKLADITISTEDFKYGPSSVKFNDQSSYIRVLDDNNNIVFGNKNFTIEYWYKPTAYADMAGISRRTNKNWPEYSNNGWVLSSTRFRAKIGSEWRENWIDDSINLENITINDWHHIALSRNNGTYRLFRNGSLVGSFFSTEPLDESDSHIAIGASSSVDLGSTERSYSLMGYLDNLIVTIGVAKYVNSFLPDANLDNTYDGVSSYSNFTDIPGATNTILILNNLGQNDNLNKYRVKLTDSVSSITVEG